DPELKEAIAGYLRRVRGVAFRPEDIVITASAMQALDLILRATCRPGDPVGCEEPGYRLARQAILAHGARLIPVPVDDDGLIVEALPSGPEAPVLVYITPSHHYPLGARLPVMRRIALLAWAASQDGLIIEDDYDGEFRYDAPPLPTMASLDTEGRVVYIGTFSKVLTPALRVGYLIVPSAPLRLRIEALR